MQVWVNPPRKTEFKPENLGNKWWVVEDSGGFLLRNGNDLYEDATYLEEFRSIESARAYIQRNGKTGDTVTITYTVQISNS